MNDYAIAKGDIAMRAQSGEITPSQAQKEIRALQDPFARFKEYASAHPDMEQAAPETKAPAMPKHGDTIERNGATYSWDAESQKYKRVRQ
jgi:hypothetical protein